ncbi:MAG: hypothetical protein AAF404_03015, partial [Pseudomonadota bacterium]
MLDNIQIKNFVLDVYNAVADQKQWPVVFDRLAELVDARGCILFEWRNEEGQKNLHAPLITSGYQHELVYAYINKYSSVEAFDQDRFEKGSMALDGIELISESALFSDEAEYLAQPHVKEMLSYDIRHRYGCLLDKDNSFRARFAIQTSHRKGLLTDQDHHVLDAVLPHVAKALDLCSPMSITHLQHQALLSIIEGLPFGVCVLDAA